VHWVLKIALGLVAGLALLVVLVFALGASLPAEHEVSRRVVLHRPAAEVWEVITDFSQAPEWRPDVVRVERSSDRGGKPVWIEYSPDGEGIPYATTVVEEQRRLVRTIADPNLPFGGTWTFELAPQDGETRVTITERGTVGNPLFRVVSTFFIGHETYMTRYLVALGKRFGEEVTPVDPR
jgi:uncharacterized protein YndB with AHSA1/START domain